MTAPAVVSGSPTKCQNCGFSSRHTRQKVGETPLYVKCCSAFLCVGCRKHRKCVKPSEPDIEARARYDLQAAVPPNDGIYAHVPESVYHADRVSLSSSGARLLTPPSVPALFQHYLDEPQKPKPQYDFGHAAHKMVLGEGGELFVLDPAVHGRTKDGAIAQKPSATSMWKEAEAKARKQGKSCITKDQMETAQLMAGKVFGHPLAGKLLQSGSAEMSGYWHDDATGARCRFRPDFLPDTKGRFVCIDYKGLALDTPIPTPTGWSTMGALSVGDEVFAADGSVCRVTGKSEVHLKDCYRMTFDDATSIVCDHDHLWPVVSGVSWRRNDVMTTQQIAQTLFGSAGRTRPPRRRHRIAVAGGLQLPPALLPVDPYVLGAWLGDGSTSDGKLTSGDAEQFDLIEARGYRCSAPHGTNPDTTPTCTIYGLRPQLRAMGLLGHKAIPDLYLRASIDQRVDLLRGLMDTDGSWNDIRSHAVFTSMNKALAEQVRELALSLGERAILHQVNGTGYGKSFVCWRVTWNPQNHNPFALARKAGATRVGTSTRSRQRIIKSCDRTVTVPTQCITVDSADNTYLCGDQMVPTHNTAVSANPTAFRKSAGDYGYHQQAAWYLDGLREVEIADDAAFLFIVQQKTPPFLVSVVQLEPEAIELGRRQNRIAIDTYAQCAADNKWPGYDEGIHTVGLPSWLVKQLEESLPPEGETA